MRNYPSSVVAITFVYDYLQGDDIDGINDALFERQDVSEFTDPVTYGDAFPAWQITVGIDDDSPAVVDIDKSLMETIQAVRNRRKRKGKG